MLLVQVTIREFYTALILHIPSVRSTNYSLSRRIAYVNKSILPILPILTLIYIDPTPTLFYKVTYVI